MNKKSGSKRKMTKGKNKNTPPPIIDQINGTSVGMNDNSFAFCISNITGIPSDIFSDINYIIKNFGAGNWYKPYIEVLHNHSYDMIFFAYKVPLLITEEKSIDNYRFNDLPRGKCIVLGRSATQFKCVVGRVDNDFKLTVVYDPDDTTNLSAIIEVGFFINTFVSPEAERDIIIHETIT